MESLQHVGRPFSINHFYHNFLFFIYSFFLMYFLWSGLRSILCSVDTSRARKRFHRCRDYVWYSARADGDVMEFGREKRAHRVASRSRVYNAIIIHTRARRAQHSGCRPLFSSLSSSLWYSPRLFRCAHSTARAYVRLKNAFLRCTARCRAIGARVFGEKYPRNARRARLQLLSRGPDGRV